MREATRGDVRGTVSTPHTQREGGSPKDTRSDAEPAGICLSTQLVRTHTGTQADKESVLEWSGVCGRNEVNSVATRGCCTHRGSRVSEKQERMRE